MILNDTKINTTLQHLVRNCLGLLNNPVEFCQNEFTSVESMYEIRLNECTFMLHNLFVISKYMSNDREECLFNRVRVSCAKVESYLTTYKETWFVENETKEELYDELYIILSDVFMNEGDF